MKCLLLLLSLTGLSSAIFVNNAASRCPITVSQAEEVCGALRKRSNHFTAHPTECAAFVQCDGLAQATVTAVPEGTMWDNEVGAAVHLQASSCPQSPCRINHDISDCSTCYGYLTCQNNEVVSAYCPDGQSFSRTESRCVSDPTCRRIAEQETLNSCTPIPNTNAYRRTGLSRGIPYSVDVTCPAATVMNTTSCVCVHSDVCPVVLGDLQNLECKGETTQYSVQGLDTNELTGDFTFTVSGLTISNAASGVVALASNSRFDAPGCDHPTFELVLDTLQRTVTLTAVSVEPKTATISAQISNPSNVNEIRVERRGVTIALYINGNKGGESSVLGAERLASTLCSLDICNSFNRNSLQGQISRVKLVRECRSQ
ncbi:uncharacterized protein LOC112564591 [Pomacea canaliculata]|uniref:uncharacterized protein LOC112564591 n=1 Tax=Pomacea canaliculata TaxID=400727 RepID=UPI000D73737B|nr:uncharacterized protein LOC112564591 [Pomacea canaliculata]